MIQCIARTRWLRCIFVLVMIVILAFAMTMDVYAFALTSVLAVSTVAVIASVLVGCGIVATNPDAFSSLVNSIKDATQFAQTLPVRVGAGVAYVAKETVDKIVAAADGLKAFDTAANTKEYASYNGVDVPVFRNLGIYEQWSSLYSKNLGDADIPWIDFDSDAALAVTSGNPFLIPFTLGGGLKLYSLYAEGVNYFNYGIDFPNGAALGTSGFALPGSRISDLIVVPYLNSYYLTPVLSESGASSDYAYKFFKHVNLGATPTITSKALYGYTDSLPICNEGVQDREYKLPKEWGKDTSVVQVPDAAGSDVYIPSLPVSIPSDDVGVIGDKSKDTTGQDAAQKGEIADGVGDGTTDVPSVDVGAAAKDAEKVKDQLVLPGVITDYFPFCIPADVVKGVQLLNAPAVKPIFEIPLKFDYEDIHFDHTVKLDLTEFDGPIRIVRWGEMLIFVIALAVATKKLIWG